MFETEGEANFARTVGAFSQLWFRSYAVLRRHVYLIADVFSLTLTLNICGHVCPLSPVPLHVCSVKLQNTHRGIFPVRQQNLNYSYYRATASQRV